MIVVVFCIRCVVAVHVAADVADDVGADNFGVVVVFGVSFEIGVAVDDVLWTLMIWCLWLL